MRFNITLFIGDCLNYLKSLPRPFVNPIICHAQAHLTRIIYENLNNKKKKKTKQNKTNKQTKARRVAGQTIKIFD